MELLDFDPSKRNFPTPRNWEFMQTALKWYDYGAKNRVRKVARQYGTLHAAQMLHDAGCPMEVALHYLARHREPTVLRNARKDAAIHHELGAAPWPQLGWYEPTKHV
jgi:hypothetical protein